MEDNGMKSIMTCPYWWWDTALDSELCDAIIAAGNKLDLQTAGIKDDKTVDKKIRETTIGFFPELHWVEALTKKYVEEANQYAGWNFILDSSELVQFGCYEVGSFYKEHRDMDHKIYGNRKLSISIQLTDGDRYDGGEFLLKNFYGGELEMPKELRNKGSIIVFPSILLHQVTKVRAGTRHSLVQWHSGPDFK
jgi:PKHD-type hydroxylase